MSEKHVIAIDLGASSGRVMDVAFDGQQIQLNETHRFPNIPVQTPNKLYWDVLRLWGEITVGIDKVAHADSIGVDTWGVDYALLDSTGELLSNPVHYRDPRNDGAMEWVFERMPRREVFERTGIQFMQINGLYQLASLVRDSSPLFEYTDTLLTIADLFNYWLTGSKTCEFTEATTLQLYNPHINDWDRDIMNAVGIPTDILTPIVQPGTNIGTYNGINVIAPACHDTGSAVVAVPTTTENYAYLSSGTWSLLGLELKEAIITDDSYNANVTNEGGYENTYRLLKNIMGLWVVDQCRSTWQANGKDYNFEQLTQMVLSVDPFKTFIEPDNSSFLPSGDMPSRVIEFCKQTNQPLPENNAEIIATVYVSLAYKYRYVLEQLMAVSGQDVDSLHIIGGGSKNALLNQMTANAIGRPVIAGPAEATATGNAIVQLISLGELSNVAEARMMLSQSMDTITYEPQNTQAWNDNYERFIALLD